MTTNGNIPAGGFTLSETQAVLERVKPRFKTEGYTLAIITEDRYQDAVDIIVKHYTPDEPMSTVFGVQRTEEDCGLTVDVLKENLSVMAVSKDNKKMVGVMISETLRRAHQIDISNVTSKSLLDKLKFEIQAGKKIDFFNHFGVDEALHLYLLSVHKDFRQKGIATTMWQASMALGAELGYKAAKADVSSLFTQKICDKEGFTTLLEMPYDKYYYNGQPMRSKTLSHTAYQVVGKAL